MKHKEVLLTPEVLIGIWESHVKYISKKLDKQSVWSYYKQQLPQAEVFGLQETLYDMCLHYMHVAFWGKSSRVSFLPKM